MGARERGVMAEDTTGNGTSLVILSRAELVVHVAFA